MTYDNLVTAIAEAERFLVKAQEARAVCEWKPSITDFGIPYSSPAIAACKRASLDLTMALVKLRNK